jgi:TPP-dependent pyruvate/acetoin dehydrogenase alpha subunit
MMELKKPSVGTKKMLNKTTELQDVYARMLLIRETEEIIRKHYASNIFKTPTHLAIGAEAIPCGVLPYFQNPRVYGTYRNHHWYLETTQDLKSLFLEMLGKQASPSMGRAGSMHLAYPQKGAMLNSAIVSSTISIALGDAWAGVRKNEIGETLCFFGDGATEEGVFWESLNFAALKKIKIVFVCEDNHLAIHAQKKNRQSFDLRKAVENYKIPYLHADATKVENVLNAGQFAKQKYENGPVFLHLEYFRSLEHVGIGEDFQFNYRPKPVDAYTEKDPLWNARQSLLRSGFSYEQIINIENEVRSGVEKTLDECTKMPDVDASKVADFVLKGLP